ncbi:MAG: hypothetical protein J6Y29_05640 [Clostridiales bacterium]|nr:hypothetical protein [Clostridiales bacterium]
MIKKRSESFGGFSNRKLSIGKKWASERDLSKLDEADNIYVLREQVLEQRKVLEKKIHNVPEQLEQLEQLKSFMQEKKDVSESIKRGEISKNIKEKQANQNMKIKNMLSTIINQNGTRFTKSELKIISNIKKAKNLEYKMELLNTLIAKKQEEKEYTTDYLNQYENLYKDIDEGIKKQVKGVEIDKELFKNRFHVIQQCEEKFKDISKDKKEFKEICEKGRIRGLESNLYNHGIVGLRENNFTKLYENIKGSKNKYLSVMMNIVKYGKKKEEKFDDYLHKNKNKIIEEIENGVAQFNEKKESNKKFWSAEKIKDVEKAIKELNSKLNDIKSKNKTDKEYQLEQLKELIKDTYKTMDTVQVEIYNNKNFKKLQKIDKMQNDLDFVHTSLCDVVSDVERMIKDEEKTINMKIYYEGVLQKNNFSKALKPTDKAKNNDFMYKDEKVIRDAEKIKNEIINMRKSKEKKSIRDKFKEASILVKRLNDKGSRGLDINILTVNNKKQEIRKIINKDIKRADKRRKEMGRQMDR